MMNTIEWDILFESPVFWGAVMGLLGVLAGHYTSRKNRKSDYDLEQLKEKIAEKNAEKSLEFESLKRNVSFLQTEFDRLNAQVTHLQTEMDRTEKAKRLLNEKYSVALQVILSGKIWFDTIRPKFDSNDVIIDGYPTIPELLLQDMPSF